jgi:hypothetical protein
LFSALLLAQAALVLAYLGLVLRRIEAPRDLPGAVLALTLLGILAMFLTYPPSANYFAYMALIVPAAAALVGIFVWIRPAAGRMRWGLRIATALIALVSLPMTGQFAGYIARDLPREHLYVPLDKYLTAQDEMGHALGFKDLAHAYCDMATWIACGRHMRSGLQAVVLATAPVPERVDAASFHQPLLGLIDTFPSLTTPVLTGRQKLERLRRLAAGLELAGLVRIPHGLDLYYVRSERGAGPIRVTELAPDGTTTRSLGENVAGEPCIWRGLPAGRYVVLTSAETESAPTVQLAGRQVSLPFSGGAHLPRALFLDVAESANLDACGGDARGLRLLRLRPAPA